MASTSLALIMFYATMNSNPFDHIMANWLIFKHDDCINNKQKDNMTLSYQIIPTRAEDESIRNSRFFARKREIAWQKYPHYFLFFNENRAAI